MTPLDIAKKHFQAALDETKNTGLDSEAMARSMLGLIIEKYLETRSVEDVQSELAFVAENCDPDTDFGFMRP